MNELALFSGAGGGILGSVLVGSRVVCAVEVDPYCREIMLRRQEEGHIPPFPVWDDVRTFDGGPWRGGVDIVSAGFPCQPFSVAGKRRGEDDRRNLWPDTIRIVREVGPRYALLENVPGLVRFDYFGQILGDLAEAGFDAQWEVVSAADCGAPHIRKRLWILAHAADNGTRRRRQFKESSQETGDVAHAQVNRREPRRTCNSKKIEGRRESHRGGGESVFPDPDGSGLSIREGGKGKRTHPSASGDGWWSTEPGMGRVVNGMAYRVDRIKALGNGQVPAVVKKALCLFGLDTQPN